MTSAGVSSESPVERIARLRAQVDALRAHVRKRMVQGANAVPAAADFSDQTAAFVADRLREALGQHPPPVQARAAQEAALVAVGGSGRREMAPYSDVDLLFLLSPDSPPEFADCVAQTVRDCWDAGLKLGHSVRTVADAVRMARQDPHTATTLVDAQGIWGSTALVEELRRAFQKRVVRSRVAQFVRDCIQAREKERNEFGSTVQQLQPDVKRSLGGLRDLQLIRWIGFAHHGVSDIDSLKLQGALSPDDARRLLLAQEFITHVRIHLHLSAGKPQDVLSREDQLRIADEFGVAGTAGQRPVERFMQQYFEHSTAIADVARRFVARHTPRPWFERAVDYVVSYRLDDIYRIGRDSLNVPRRHRAAVCGSLEGVLRLYLTAVRCRVRVAPPLLESVKTAARQLPAHVSPEAARLFLEMLGRPGVLGAALRDLYDAGVLELLLPSLKHMRCLLQFNQYHSYTVDEHTLRAIEAAERFDADPGPLGRAYREIRHKELLHLALLLHDAGKGFEEDHSEVGRRLALEAAQRLGLPEHQRDLLVFLVHRHLLMATLAFRRDTSDPEVLLNFNHEVGSPDALQLLYVLTAADISAVGPGVWNDWKAELLTALYDRSQVWLSGQSHLFDEPTRLQRVVADVQRHLAPPADGAAVTAEQLGRRIAALPKHYLLATAPAQIAADLECIDRRAADEIRVRSQYDAETGTVEYRIITHEAVCSGCFHKITGVLSAKRMEILSAQICTCQDGVIIDSYRVHDYDHAGEVPEFRRAEVAEAIEKTLRGAVDVETLFRSRLRFAPHVVAGPVSNLPMRVVVDNETSDRFTIVDVFAHDRPGLLYRIARTIYECGLSVVLAKISTHFDQVVDVFYLTDGGGDKIRDGQRLRQIRDDLVERLTEFERQAAEAVCS